MLHDYSNTKWVLIPAEEVTDRMIEECDNISLETLPKGVSDTEDLRLLQYTGRKPYSLYGRDAILPSDLADTISPYSWS